jgi:isopenicillin N synthase-like dioxygenase
LLLADLRRALIEVGFLYIENHGVAHEVIADIQDALPKLFSLSADAKQQVALVKSPHFLGYSGDSSEVTAGAIDRREQFEFANELVSTWTDGQPLCDRLRGPNPVSRFPYSRENLIHEA